RVLVRLGARVAQEDSGEGGRTPCREPLGQLLSLGQRYRGGIEQEGLRLFFHGPDHVRMAMSRRSDRMTAIGVEPLISVFVDQPRSMAANRTNRHLGIDRQQRWWVFRRLTQRRGLQHG